MKVHQNIIVDGKDLGDRPSRKHSKFCNEGKWDNFIAPLLLEDCTDMTLVEFGSNAGMFLKMAIDRGFSRAVGIEYQEKEYGVSIEYSGCKVINTFVDENFDYDQLPVADVVLLPNFHYHQPVQTTARMVDALLRKTRYVVLVGIDRPAPRHWKTDARIGHTRGYFRDWEEVGVVEPISTEGDPHPRNGMYGISFKSQLERMPVDKIHKGKKEIKYGEAVTEFVTRLVSGEDISLEDTDYWKKVMAQKERHQPAEVTVEYLCRLGEHLSNIGEVGMRHPILVDKDYNLLDGGHRLLAAKVTGQDSIIGRIL